MLNINTEIVTTYRDSDNKELTAGSTVIYSCKDKIEKIAIFEGAKDGLASFINLINKKTTKVRITSIENIKVVDEKGNYLD